MQSQEEQQAVLTLPKYRYQEHAVHTIHADVAQFVAQGAITGTISKVEIEWRGARYQLYPAPSTPVELPAGENFDVYVTYSANNPQGASVINPFQTCATMMATDGSLANYDLTREVSGSPSGIMKLDALGQPGPMPDYNISLRFRLFAYPEGWNTPPPQSMW